MKDPFFGNIGSEPPPEEPKKPTNYLHMFALLYAGFGFFAIPIVYRMNAVTENQNYALWALWLVAFVYGLKKMP